MITEVKTMPVHKFERDGIVSIVYNGDCNEGMRWFEDRKFDLACVDPPYGIGAAKMQMGKIRGQKINWEKKGWDDGIPDAPYYEQLMRCSKNQIIWGGQLFYRSFTSFEMLACME